ncbi:serine-rich adhesin for platelets [Drosophila montana]|uniref:serine-rich adhesin for platelets n=1 Tax=Drosophila montana TaxID=40370 RepID=UPI00313C0762
MDKDRNKTNANKNASCSAARCKKPDTCIHLRSLRQQQIKAGTSTQVLYRGPNFQAQRSDEDIFFDCLSIGDTDFPREGHSCKMYASCKTITSTNPTMCSKASSKKATNSCKTTSTCNASASSKFDDPVVVRETLERAANATQMLLRNFERNKRVCKRPCSATLEITARLLTDPKETSSKCRLEGRPVTVQMPLQFDPNTGQMVTSQSRPIEKETPGCSKLTCTDCPALMYMQDERRYPMNADALAPNYRTQDIQTDQSHLRNEAQRAVQRQSNGDEMPSHPTQTQNSRNQQDMEEGSAELGKPSQTDTSYLHDHYVRSLGNNFVADKLSQTRVISCDFYNMGKIHYPTQYICRIVDENDEQMQERVPNRINFDENHSGRQHPVEECICTNNDWKQIIKAEMRTQCQQTDSCCESKSQPSIPSSTAVQPFDSKNSAQSNKSSICPCGSKSMPNVPLVEAQPPLYEEPKIQPQPSPIPCYCESDEGQSNDFSRQSNSAYCSIPSCHTAQSGTVDQGNDVSQPSNTAYCSIPSCHTAQSGTVDQVDEFSESRNVASSPTPNSHTEQSGIEDQAVDDSQPSNAAYCSIPSCHTAQSGTVDQAVDDSQPSNAAYCSIPSCHTAQSGTVDEIDESSKSRNVASSPIPSSQTGQSGIEDQAIDDSQPSNAAYCSIPSCHTAQSGTVDQTVDDSQPSNAAYCSMPSCHVAQSGTVDQMDESSKSRIVGIAGQPNNPSQKTNAANSPMSSIHTTQSCTANQGKALSQPTNAAWCGMPCCHTLQSGPANQANALSQPSNVVYCLNPSCLTAQSGIVDPNTTRSCAVHSGLPSLLSGDSCPRTLDNQAGVTSVYYSLESGNSRSMAPSTMPQTGNPCGLPSAHSPEPSCYYSLHSETSRGNEKDNDTAFFSVRSCTSRPFDNATTFDSLKTGTSHRDICNCYQRDNATKYFSVDSGSSRLVNNRGQKDNATAFFSAQSCVSRPVDNSQKDDATRFLSVQSCTGPPVDSCSKKDADTAFYSAQSCTGPVNISSKKDNTTTFFSARSCTSRPGDKDATIFLSLESGISRPVVAQPNVGFQPIPSSLTAQSYSEGVFGKQPSVIPWNMVTAKSENQSETTDWRSARSKYTAELDQSGVDVACSCLAPDPSTRTFIAAEPSSIAPVTSLGQDPFYQQAQNMQMLRGANFVDAQSTTYQSARSEPSKTHPCSCSKIARSDMGTQQGESFFDADRSHITTSIKSRPVEHGESNADDVSQHSSAHQVACNKSSLGYADKTSSRSQSVMANITCLCSSDQRMKLGLVGREGREGPPFTKVEESGLECAIVPADPVLVSKMFSVAATKDSSCCQSCNVAPSTKVVFMNRTDKFCDCYSSSETSIGGTAVKSLSEFQDIESGPSSCNCDKVSSRGMPIHKGQRLVGCKSLDPSVPYGDQQMSMKSAFTCSCNQPMLSVDYKSANSATAYSKSCLTTSKCGVSMPNFSLAPDAEGTKISGQNRISPEEGAMEQDGEQVQVQEQVEVRGQDQVQSPVQDQIQVEHEQDSYCECRSERQVTSYRSCVSNEWDNAGSPKERILNILNLLSDSNDCCLDRTATIQQLFRELTLMLRREEEDDEEAAEPLSYEDCMAAVTAGRLPPKKQPKSKDKLERMQCLDQMEKYLEKCFPLKTGRTIQPTEIVAFERDPNFDPYRKPYDTDADSKDTNFVSCHTDVEIHTPFASDSYRTCSKSGSWKSPDSKSTSNKSSDWKTPDSKSADSKSPDSISWKSPDSKSSSLKSPDFKTSTPIEGSKRDSQVESISPDSIRISASPPSPIDEDNKQTPLADMDEDDSAEATAAAPEIPEEYGEVDTQPEEQSTALPPEEPEPDETTNELSPDSGAHKKPSCTCGTDNESTEVPPEEPKPDEATNEITPDSSDIKKPSCTCGPDNKSTEVPPKVPKLDEATNEITPDSGYIKKPSCTCGPGNESTEVPPKVPKPDEATNEITPDSGAQKKPSCTCGTDNESTEVPSEEPKLDGAADEEADEEVDEAEELTPDSGAIQKPSCICDQDSNDLLSPLTDRERLLCEYMMRRMCELCGDEQTVEEEATDGVDRPGEPCVCCHCRALACDNQCKTVSKTLDAVRYDPVAETKFFIDSIICDLHAMNHVMNKNKINPKTPNPSPCMGNGPGESFPVTITDVSSLGCRALYVRWQLDDCAAIGGYEIYVDGHLTNRFYSYRHESGVVANVDVTKRHQIVLRAQAVGQEFPGDEVGCGQNAMVHAHPEMLVGASRPWTPSVFFYEP